jgi:hypothetical protein
MRRPSPGSTGLTASRRGGSYDSLVQGLTAIHWALEAGAYEQARALTATALAQAQGMIGDLLEDHPEGHAFAPGALRRERAA